MRTLIDLTLLFIINLSGYFKNTRIMEQGLEYELSSSGDAPFINITTFNKRK